jgi:hypothetical protein
MQEGWMTTTAVADHEARQGWLSRDRAATNLLTVDANAMNFYSMPPPRARVRWGRGSGHRSSLELGKETRGTKEEEGDAARRKKKVD